MEPGAGHFELDGVSFSPFFTPEEHLVAIKDFDMTAEDVLIVAFPRTGSMWLQDIMYQLYHPDDDQPGKQFILDRVMHLEMPRPGKTRDQYMKDLKEASEPRLYKTHLMPSFLGSKILKSGCKLVLLLRNPKDALVSAYHFYLSYATKGFAGTWDEFFNDFVSTKRGIWGDWFDFVSNWWKTLQTRSNHTIVKYEELKENPVKEITKLAKCCELNVSDSIVKDIANRTKFATSKKNDSLGLRSAGYEGHDVSVVMRRGEVGSWKEYFTPEQNEYVNKRLRLLEEETGLKFTM